MSTSTSTSTSSFVLCIEAGEYDGELLVGKVYRVTRKRRGDEAGDLRIIDESGEDYLYPAAWFVAIDLPSKAKKALAAHAASAL